MAKAKYIAINRNNTFEEAIVFAETLTHAEMAQALRDSWPRMEVVGAGFVAVGSTSDGLTAHAYGESVSLNMKSRPQDDKLVQIALGLYYY